jgi:hypothetical protein
VGCLSTKNTGLSALTRSFSSVASSLLCPAFRPYCTTTQDPIDDLGKKKVRDLRASLERRGVDPSELTAEIVCGRWALYRDGIGMVSPSEFWKEVYYPELYPEKDSFEREGLIGGRDGSIDEVYPEMANPPLDDPVKESIRLAAMSGANIFFTGSAGTGKSFTIDAIVEGLKAKHGDDYADAVAVTAPTGVASLLIGGQTLGSFAGVHSRCWGPGDDKGLCKLFVWLPSFLLLPYIVLRSSRSHY